MKKTILWLAITALLVMLPFLALAQEAGYLPQEQLLDGEAISYNSPAVETAIANAVADKGDATNPADVAKHAKYIGIGVSYEDAFDIMAEYGTSPTLFVDYYPVDGGKQVSGVTDLSCLQFCKNAKVLFINCEEVTGLEVLETLPKLTAIIIRTQKPVDLTPLQSVKKLTQIGFVQCKGYDYTPLQALTSTTELLFVSCDEVDLLFTLGYSKLNTFTLENTNARNIALLSTQKKLQNLTLGNCGATPDELNAIFVASAGKLDNVHLSGVDVSTCDALFELKNLWSLSLDECTGLPRDPQKWQKLTKLYGVSLFSCDFFSIECVQKAKKLEWITLAGMDIMGDAGTSEDGTNVNNDPALWGSLKKLDYVELVDCNLTSCEFLANSANLMALVLNNNEITDVSPIASLTKLTYLDLTGSPVTDYSVLDDLPKLEYIEK